MSIFPLGKVKTKGLGIKVYIQYRLYFILTFPWAMFIYMAKVQKSNMSINWISCPLLVTGRHISFCCCACLIVDVYGVVKVFGWPAGKSCFWYPGIVHRRLQSSAWFPLAFVCCWCACLLWGACLSAAFLNRKAVLSLHWVYPSSTNVSVFISFLLLCTLNSTQVYSLVLWILSNDSSTCILVSSSLGLV